MNIYYNSPALLFDFQTRKERMKKRRVAKRKIRKIGKAYDGGFVCVIFAPEAALFFK